MRNFALPKEIGATEENFGGSSGFSVLFLNWFRIYHLPGGPESSKLSPKKAFGGGRVRFFLHLDFQPVRNYHR